MIEGAGSPAEINLRADDIVNMGLAEAVDAPVILIGDIDRGGVFAALYGTVKLLSEAEQARIKGLVINKFRGDIKILEPGLRQIGGAHRKAGVSGFFPIATLIWRMRIPFRSGFGRRKQRRKPCFALP